MKRFATTVRAAHGASAVSRDDLDPKQPGLPVRMAMERDGFVVRRMALGER